MNKDWPTVKLGEVLRLDLHPVAVDAATNYPMVGVLSFGRGLFSKETVEHGNTSYRMFYELKSNHLVMSQLFGWEGAIALSSGEYAGQFLSPQFPTFLCDESKLDRSFLGWMIRRPAFWADLGSRTSGMGDRRRTLNPEALFACSMPLPPLAEQHRISARIENLGARIQEAQALRKLAAEEVEALIISNHIRLAGDRRRRLGEIIQLNEDTVTILQDGSYPQVGVRSFGGGLFPKAAISGTETTYRIFNRLFDGAIVLSQVKGWEGALAVCPKDLDGWFVSPEYRTFRCIDGESSPHYLAALVRTEWFWSRLTNATRGVGARRERTRPEQFLNIEMPMPDLTSQRVGEKAIAEVETLARLQAETATELNALLPSVLSKAFAGGL